MNKVQNYLIKTPCHALYTVRVRIHHLEESRIKGTFSYFISLVFCRPFEELDLLNCQGGDAIDLVTPVPVLLFCKEPIIRELHDIALDHI